MKNTETSPSPAVVSGKDSPEDAPRGVGHRRPYTFDRVVRIIAGILLLAAAIWLVNDLKDVLLPFFVACLLAYLMDPLVRLNMKWFRFRKRGVPAIITLLEVALAVGLLGYFFIPSIIKEIAQLISMLDHTSDRVLSIPYLPAEIEEPVRRWLSSLDVESLLKSSHFESLLSSGSSVVASIFDFLLHTLEWLLTFIYVIFILIDYRSLMDGFKLMIPRRYRSRTMAVIEDVKDSMNKYFRNQALIALCAAVFYCIGFSIVGIPLAIVLGITVGILYMIPYFQYVTLIPVALVCMAESLSGQAHFWPEFGSCLLVYVVSQCICDYVLTPKIMGKAMGLNPAIILLSLSVWGSLMGIIGMIIALPLTTLLLSYYQKYADRD